METQIVPCRAEISDRFPVASFAVNVPPSRLFEVACATDPRLFHSDWQRYRSPRNFYSSRSEGLMRAPEGQTAWFIPPEQLRRFAGSPRIYYALATYENRYGGTPEFSISPQALERVPSIGVAADFTGRGLDRSRLGPSAPQPDHYGAAAQAGAMTWGGDEALAALRAAGAPEESAAYDDGYPGAPWDEPGADAPTAAPAGLGEAPYEDAAACDEADAYDDNAPAAGMAEDGGGDPDAYGLSDGYDDTVEVPADLAEGAAAGVEPDSPAASGEAAYDDAPAAGAALADAWGEPPEDGAEEWTGDGYGAVHDHGDDADEDGEDPDADDRYGGAEGLAGYEDAAALYGAAEAGAAYGPAYGSPEPEGGVAVADAPPDDAEAYPGEEAYPAAEGMAGRDPGYSEEEPEEEPLPVGRAAQALATVALDIPEKVRILRVVAIAESGRDGYAAINADTEFNDPAHPAYQRYHVGLSWGFVQFTQRSGALGKVLQAIQRREEGDPSIPAEHRFGRLFGPDAGQLVAVTGARDPEARVAEVGGKPLWHPEWTARFRAAGRVPHVTYAQNEVAVTEYADPNLRFAAWLGFDTARALAMLWDRCIHMGNGGGRSWIMRHCGPIRTDEDRRAALAALGHADVRAFQQSQAPHLEVDGRWGPRTHAALLAALRGLGSRAPVAVPGRDALLQRMVEAARPTRFARRVAALHGNRTDFDDTTTCVLV